jgi:hypothetical protein
VFGRQPASIAPTEDPVAVACDEVIDGITKGCWNQPENPHQIPGEAQVLIYRKNGIAIPANQIFFNY